MKSLDKYNEELDAIYDYFGFSPDWVVCPIDDRREYLWELVDNNTSVRYAETQDKMDSDGDYYEDRIYTQRFYSKHIWHGIEYTMVFVDTRVDGMRYFAIYDNSKQIKCVR